MSDTRAPSSYRVMLAGDELAQLRETLLAIDPSIEQDQTLFADMLEGEGGDALFVIEQLIEASVESDALADAAKTRKADIAERQARFEKRRDAYRVAALLVFERINLRKLERPAWTASIRALPPKVVVTDEAALLPAYVRTKVEPDKEAIARVLRDGRTVAGAEMSNGGTGLTVRTK